MDILYWAFWVIVAFLVVGSLLSWFTLNKLRRLRASLGLLLVAIILAVLLYFVASPWMLSQAISVSIQPRTQSQTTTATVTVTSTPTPTATPTLALTTTAQAQQTVTPPMLTSTPTGTPTQSPTTTTTSTVTVTSTSTLAPAPRLVITEPTQQSGAVQSGCPTDNEMQTMLGFNRMSPGIKPVFTGENIPWDPCKWNWQANEKTTLVFTLPNDWQSTITRAADGVVQVYYGPVELNVRGFTLRYRPVYNTESTSWVNDPCELIKRENAFGQRRLPSYNTTSGNVSCSSSPTPTLSQSGTITTTTSISAKSSIDQQWLAKNIGGNADKWTPPTWSGGAWVFNDKGKPVSLRYPREGRLEVWIRGSTSITAANATVLEGKTFDEASYHPR